MHNPVVPFRSDPKRYSGVLASLALSSGAIHGTRGINAVPSMARYWVFPYCRALPVHLVRNLLSDSAGGEPFSGRQRPFAGESSWLEFTTLPTRSRVGKEPLGFRRDGNVRIAVRAHCRGSYSTIGKHSRLTQSPYVARKRSASSF